MSNKGKCKCLNICSRVCKPHTGRWLNKILINKYNANADDTNFTQLCPSPLINSTVFSFMYNGSEKEGTLDIS